MLQEYQSAYFHFFRLKMTQSIGLEKSANLFDFSYKYLSITWLPKKCQNSKQLYGFWQDKNFAKSYKFVTKTVAPKYFYFLSLNDKIKIQNISIKTAVHKCSKAGRKKENFFQWKYKQWMLLLQPFHVKHTSYTCQRLLTNVCTARIGSKMMLGITIELLTLPNCANFQYSHE